MYQQKNDSNIFLYKLVRHHTDSFLKKTRHIRLLGNFIIRCRL